MRRKLPTLTGFLIAVALDGDGLVSLRFINIRNDSIGVVIRAKRR